MLCSVELSQNDKLPSVNGLNLLSQVLFSDMSQLQSQSRCTCDSDMKLQRQLQIQLQLYSLVSCVMDSSQSSLQIPKSQSTKEPIVAKTPAKEKPKVIILTPVSVSGRKMMYRRVEVLIEQRI